MLAGYSKCPSKFLFEARIQADFNIFYPELSMHGSIYQKQGKDSIYLCKVVNRFEFSKEVSFLAHLNPFVVRRPFPLPTLISTNRFLPFAPLGNSLLQVIY